jgi:hypothetical protein
VSATVTKQPGLEWVGECDDCHRTGVLSVHDAAHLCARCAAAAGDSAKAPLARRTAFDSSAWLALRVRAALVRDAGWPALPGQRDARSIAIETASETEQLSGTDQPSGKTELNNRARVLSLLQKTLNEESFS